jgi:outer membrane receptor protein involved in Fe transport
MLIGTGKRQYKHHNILTWMLVCIFLSLLQTLTALADDTDKASAKDLTDMSLNELMDVKIYVPGTITETNPLKTPASVTIITAEDIDRTPARNILDLLETYVPGAIYLNHSVGPVPGFRGILVDRPYKFLVNVNGINVNIKSEYGARLELLNWEMSDIARIEVIRGPGSVTYGPGAIAGVINIYTKSAKQAPGLNMGGTYWDKYKSIGNYISYGQDSNKSSVYAYFSVVDTEGVSPDLFGVSSSTSGYVGSNGGPYSPSPVATYMSDYYEEPQIKAHLDYHFNDNWRFWARYVTSSSSLIQGNAIQYQIDGDWTDFRQTRYRYIQTALENSSPLKNDFELESTFAFHSIDVHNVEKYDSSIDNDKDNLQNIGWIWAEHQIFSRFMLNYKPDDEKIKAAFGAEMSYDIIGPGWGKDEDDGLRLSDGIISGPSSDAYGTGYRQVTEASSTYFAVGDGWETFSYAFLGELNIELMPKTTALLSARLDKHTYTDYMFSPRAALIQELRKNEYLKFIAQRSVRMNTQEELYMNHELGSDNDPEILDSLELIYSAMPTEHLSIQTAGFLNYNEVIAWDAAQRRSAHVGNLTTAGLEVETEYKKDDFSIGANHSYVKQLDWDLDEDMSVSGISYSDYYQDAGGGVIIKSNGNNLNNWPTQATKLFTNVGLFDKKMLFHANMKILWGFEGSEDGLNALSDAGGNSAAIDNIRDKDAYGIEISANLSLTYNINKDARFRFFVQNIPIVGDNKRYSYSSGYKLPYPDKTSWIEEPMVVGFSYRVRF